MATDKSFVSTWLDGGERRSPAIKISTTQISVTELVFIAGITGIIVIGWVALLLAQFGGLSATSLLLSLGPPAVAASILTVLRRYPLPHVELTWHDAALAGILLVAAVLYTPPADYAPAFLDAGWYTNTAALVERTGSLTARPALLETLAPADRTLFVRTYHDLRASMPRFPDRADLGFYNLAFAVDLGGDGPVTAYHPPFASVWIAVLRLVGGARLGAYAAPLFGLLFVLAVFAAGRALFGPNVALVAALLTALSPPVVYYARTPFAELLAGALIWAGVYAITRYAAGTTSLRRSTYQAPSGPQSALWWLNRSPARAKSPAPTLILAGAAFGTALLVKFESLLLLPALGLFWLIWLRRRWATRREFLVFLAPFGLLLGHAGLLYATLLKPYAVLNGYGIRSLVMAALTQPALWVGMTTLYLVGLAFLLAKRGGWIGNSETTYPASYRVPREAASSNRVNASRVRSGDGWTLLPRAVPFDRRGTGSVAGPPTYGAASGKAGFDYPQSNGDLVSEAQRNSSTTRSRAREAASALGRRQPMLWSLNLDTLRAAASLLVLFSAGIALLLAWPAAQANSPATWPSLVTLSLFLTPLGLCLGLVGLSALVAEDLNRRTAFLVIMLGTAGIVTLLMPAISSDVSHLYTVRRQLPIVLPGLLLLTSYVALRWAGLADGAEKSSTPARLRRGLVILILALLAINFLDVGQRLGAQPELAGSSTFVTQLAQSFGPDDVVLFESVDRGVHVGRFAAPLWAEHGVNAMLLSSTYPPQDRLTDVIARWQAQGWRVFFVSGSNPPPFALPGLQWNLADKKYWAGVTIAAKMSFPPESWMVQVPFYIYEAK